jgi:FG-GAP-like repeat
VLDLITANNCGDNSTCQGVTVYLGRPNGACFNGASSGPAGLPANDIAIGDFNGDGKLDVAMTGYLGGGTESFKSCWAAGATDATPVTAIQVYADNKLVFQSSGDSLNMKLPLSRGSHFLVTKASDAAGHDFWSPRPITIYRGIPGETCTLAPWSTSLRRPNRIAPSRPCRSI